MFARGKFCLKKNVPADFIVNFILIIHVPMIAHIDFFCKPINEWSTRQKKQINKEKPNNENGHASL